MTKIGEEGTMDPLSACDSYRELELYLEKVSEEFGEVFDRWLGGEVVKPNSNEPPVPPIRTKRSRLLNGHTTPKMQQPKPKSTPIEWSESVMHDFDRLIAQELSQLELEVGAIKSPSLVNVSPQESEGGALSTEGLKQRGGHIDTKDSSENLMKVAYEVARRDASRDIDSGFESGLVSAATQTSPTLSRSSSFTWRSDCSSFIPDASSSASSTPSPSSSPSVSPCPPDDSIDSSPETSRFANLAAFVPLRERGRVKKRNSGPRGSVHGADVWVRRESVHTQTIPLHDPALHMLMVDESHPPVSPLLSDGGASGDDTVLTTRPPVPPVGGSLPRPTRLTMSGGGATQLPSPTSASLKLVASPMPPELASKSSSAPAITKKPAPGSTADLGTLRHPRSQSERQVAEVEAEETCCWLRAAGFPQYAQLFEDSQFPIDVAAVHKDHPFLDKDSLRSLYRRLHTLNRCARLKIDPNKASIRESDEDELCALSDNWTFQPEIRRWSRLYEGFVPPSTDGKQHEALRRGKSLPPGGTPPMTDSNFHRTGSERLKEGAKALLRRMEGLKSKRRRKSNRATKPKVVQADQNQSCSESQDNDEGSLSDPSWPIPDTNSHQSWGLPKATPPSADSGSSPEQNTVTTRPGWRDPVNQTGWSSPILGTKSLPRLRNHGRSPSFQRKRYGYMDRSFSPEVADDSSSTVTSHPDSDAELSSRHKMGIVRWHSLRRPTSPTAPSLGTPACPQAIGGLSAGQLMVLRKLALLKLTACMEKHCPPLRSNWTWDLPTFIRKIKSPDYKGRRVFGVPLSVVVQRTGQALPEPIQAALRWLRANALEQVGLFRKSGVRSRIHAIKVLTEELGEEVSYDGQQAYDVADMVKQYLRELPESIFSSKLTETFLSIFQHVPGSEQAGAVQWAILLLPDEHREALQTIVDFLHLVAVNSCVNQMTASNLAVCLAPSLFHLHAASPSPARSGSSPRRRKQVGVPDQRELGENKAAHDCLLHLIMHAKCAFEVPQAMLTACRFSSLEASVPMTLKELGQEAQGWRGFMQDSTHAFLKEVRERSRGWVACTSSDPETELAYKKVRDGHPLRLWRATTEVEAPPTELLQRVLRERHVWDPSVLQWRVVTRLDTNAEVFQFVCASMPPLPAKDYCVLRTWRTDLPRGACVVVETSVEDPSATVPPGGVRGVVLASRYLIRPCGGGRTRLVLLTRVDTKGRSAEWYNKSFGHLCASQLSNLRLSFSHHTTDGPESKV